jgi:hypothetical protein
MRTEMSRRALVGCLASVGLSPAIAVRLEKFPTVIETPVDPLERNPGRPGVQELIDHWRDLMRRHEATYAHFAELYRDVEPCPENGPTDEWWDRYRETPACKAEDLAEDLLCQADDLLTTIINDTPCRDEADAAAKLRLVLEDKPLWDAEQDEQYALRRILFDLEALS